MIIDIHYHLMNEGWDPDKLYLSATKLFEKSFGTSSEEKIKHADVVIDTNCSMEELKTRVTGLWEEL